MFKLILSSGLILLSSHVMAQDIPNFQKVIYGQDDRVEVDDFHDAKFRDFANSVAGRVSSYQLNPSLYDASSDSFNIMADTLSNAMNVCDGERFANQKVYSDCTGFLVGPKTLVTAGHCMTSEVDCDSFKWVFNYKADSKQIPSKDIYSCKKIIDHKMKYSLLGALITDTDRDFAVIELDREVEGATPLEFRTEGKIKVSDKVLVIGHPSGLPMKIANNARVAKTYGNTFKTELDTYGGNSGSPVFNEKTGLVEGILIQGAEDYIAQNGCFVSNHENGKKERVFKITKVKTIQDMKKKGEL